MSSAADNQNSVYIFGSCVARDTFEYLPSATFKLLKYTARQSLISAFSQPTPLDDKYPEQLDSEFQRRMLRSDFEGSLALEIREIGREADTLVWDLTDERFGVWDLGDGRYVTRSIELIKSGLDLELRDSCTLIPFGSYRHRALWSNALRTFEANISALAPQTQLLLLNPPWAHLDESGRPVKPGALGPGTRFANRNLKRYAAQSTKFRTISLRRSPSAAEEHQWGSAPYHYTPEVYNELAVAIERAALAMP